MKAQTEACSAQFKHATNHHGFELVAAVVEQALLDINDGVIPVEGIKDSTTRLRNAEQAAHWISERAVQPLVPWTFSWCCEVLGFDCASIRRGMLVGNKLAKLKELRRRLNARIAKMEKEREPIYRERKKRREYLATLTHEQRLEERRAQARRYMETKRAKAKAKQAALEKRRIQEREQRQRQRTLKSIPMELGQCSTQLSQLWP